MTLFMDFGIFVGAWLFLYAFSEDILRFIAKYLLLLTALCALWEGMVVYGQSPTVFLFAFVVAVLMLELVLDTMYKMVLEPLQTAAGVVMVKKMVRR